MVTDKGMRGAFQVFDVSRIVVTVCQRRYDDDASRASDPYVLFCRFRIPRPGSRPCHAFAGIDLTLPRIPRLLPRDSPAAAVRWIICAHSASYVPLT